jgi:hypothetical protein
MNGIVYSATEHCEVYGVVLHGVAYSGTAEEQPMPNRMEDKSSDQ